MPCPFSNAKDAGFITGNPIKKNKEAARGRIFPLKE